LTPDRIRVRIPNDDWDPAYALEPDYDPDVDGRPYFDLLGLALQRNGGVTVSVGGVPQTIAVMSIAMFSNAPGLERVGNSLYRESPASGAAVITQPLREGSGPVVSGGLEMSNVDLGTEFTDMIVTQRGFQANSRVITVTDSMLEELVNLRR
jgi:flagellar hook protein FlgE